MFVCLYVAVVCVDPKLAQSYWTEFGNNNVHGTFILGQYRCTQVEFGIFETNPSFVAKNPNIFLSFMVERPSRSRNLGPLPRIRASMCVLLH